MSNLLTLQSSKYGVTERKKQELDELSQKVLNAESLVEQLEAIVNSLTDKSNKLKTDLATAETNKNKALSNKDLVDEVVENLLTLKNNSELTFNETVLAESKIKKVSKEISHLIDKLIFSAEIINKLGNLVIRTKATNPLISDELVTMVTTASSDANNAVALTLVALQSVFAAQATTKESEAAVALEMLQAIKLYEFVIGDDTVDNIQSDVPLSPATSIRGLLYTAYVISENMYNQALAASNDTIKQLNNTKRELSKAQINLSSLQAGYAAANAAALAS
ncbi:hypothetical protein KORDIASMS9_01472 [Kordia sp. SMS9]|uniref:hypothetical protein n=1 Tax=Kordia sp. SMS9 TaxID=2282170 RepID=UPI000E0D117C|nr:hypothetical protein [Kordia sp. SMS9]AXG69252.1 hypothetical protein KORDIASMS9_01472 [Kordia sp. SMS9]